MARRRCERMRESVCFCRVNAEAPPPDWVEFSPYEIGMAKYGTFMTPDLFGSKFFMGTVVKKYEENPLHFLMGEMELKSCASRNRAGETTTNPLTACVCVCVCVCSGVWGSAFSILFNRVLGVKDSVGGSTMEEELGNVHAAFHFVMNIIINFI